MHQNRREPEIKSAKRPMADDVDLAAISKRTDGRSGAELAAVCNEAVMLAIREYVLAGKSQEDEEIAKYRIESKHFDEALKKVMPSKKERDVYSKFAEFA